MKVDFSHVDDIESFVTVPEGTYLCTIQEVREGLTRDGAPRWWYRLEVVEGDHAGRTAAWDGLSFSPRGLPRVKAVLDRLGLDTEGLTEVDSQDLVGRSAYVEIQVEQRDDPQKGRRVARTTVPYMGYQAAPDPLPTVGPDSVDEQAVAESAPEREETPF